MSLSHLEEYKQLLTLTQHYLVQESGGSHPWVYTHDLKNWNIGPAKPSEFNPPKPVLHSYKEPSYIHKSPTSTPIPRSTTPPKQVQQPKDFPPPSPASLQTTKKEPIAPKPIEPAAHQHLYPNNLKNWNLGLAKTRGFDLPKSTPYDNIGPISEVESRKLSLEPKTNFSNCLDIDLSDFWKILSERFPQQKLIKEVPLLYPVHRVIILSTESDPQSCELLEKMTLAITTHLAPAELVAAAAIEQKKEWESFLNANLQLIIACESLIHSLPQLKSYYRQNSSQSFLGPVPFLPLLDLARYRQEPQLKNALWTVLRKILKP